MPWITLLIVAALAIPLSAQEWIGARDFLTEHEVEQIRIAQEPNERITAYLHFAELRLALIDQLFAKDEPGRGGKVHQNLSELGRILEALDMVIDDALLRDVDLEVGLGLVREQEPKILARLEEIRDSEPEDLWRYEFVLEDAIEITADSLELAGVDPTERKREIIDADEAEKAARDETMTTQRREEVEKADKSFEKVEKEAEAKRPSLLKAGETVGDPPPAPPRKKK